MGRLKIKYKYILDENNIDVIGQFITLCKELARSLSLEVDPYFYINRYNDYTSKEGINKFIKVQEGMYSKLKSAHPDIDFGIRGRTKSSFSFFQKILNKLEEFPEAPVIYDEFANKIFIRSRNCRIHSTGINKEGPYIIYGKEHIPINPNDIIEINLNNECYRITISTLHKTLCVKNNNIYVKGPNNLLIPIQNATLIKSNENELNPRCYDFSNEINDFYSELNFKSLAQKDYIAHPKKCGYSSLHHAYSGSFEMHHFLIETQIKTADMELDSKTKPGQNRSTYKPESRILTPNSINKVPTYILTTAFASQTDFSKFTCGSIIAPPEKCWKYTFKDVKEDNPELYEKYKEQYIALSEKKKIPPNVSKYIDDYDLEL